MSRVTGVRQKIDAREVGIREAIMRAASSAA